MRARHTLLSLLFPLLCLPSCAKSLQKEEETDLDQEPASPDAYRSEHGRFSVVFPDPPREPTKSENTTDGVVRYRFAVVEWQTVYTVAFWDLLPRATFDFDAARDSVVRKPDYKLEKETQLQLGRHSGREWEIQIFQPVAGYMVYRNYLIGRRVYEVFVFEEGEKGPTERGRKFLDSFRIHK